MLDAEGERHAAFGAELVDEDFVAGVAGDVFEEEGWAAGFCFGVAVEAGLRDTVGDLGDFEIGRDFFADAAELAGFIEDFDPVSEVVAGQVGSPVWLRS
jgi:hypothetical protein